MFCVMVPQLSARVWLHTEPPLKHARQHQLLKELLAMVPQPVLAVLLLFPITPESDAAAKAGASGESRCERRRRRAAAPLVH